MDAIQDMLSRGFGQLLDRADGPLHFRLAIMPTVVSILAIRAGLKDAREGRPAFFWAILTNPAERKELFRSALKDVGKIFTMAVVLDTAYQLYVLRAFYIVQVLIVAVACALVPYALIRGPVTRLTRRFFKNEANPINKTAADLLTREPGNSRGIIREAANE